MARDTDREQNRGKMTVSEAGRKGGEAVRDKYGPEFYSEIGSQSHKGKTAEETQRGRSEERENEANR